MGTGFSSSSVGGRSSQPSRAGTSYSRPGANRAQKCRNPGTITLATGRLYDVPVRLGWLDRSLAEDDLNPVAMFL